MVGSRIRFSEGFQFVKKFVCRDTTMLAASKALLPWLIVFLLKIGNGMRSQQNVILHPLIYTLRGFSLTRDVEKKKAEPRFCSVFRRTIDVFMLRIAVVLLIRLIRQPQRPNYPCSTHHRKNIPHHHSRELLRCRQEKMIFRTEYI